MKGKTIIIRTLGNFFWQFDSKRKNARGKKRSWAKAEAKRASRAFRHKRKTISESE